MATLPRLKLYKMKRIIYLFFAFILAVSAATVSASDTDAPETITKKFKINANYSKISVSNGIIVNYEAKPGITTSMAEIRGSKELVERVDIEVEDDELEISMTDGRNNRSVGSVVVNLTGPVVSDFETSSAAIININSPISTNGTFETDQSSASAININNDVTAREFTFDLSSGSMVNGNGKLKASMNCIVDISSGSKVELSNIECEKVSVDSSSGAIARLSGKATAGTIDASSGSIVDFKNFKVGKLTVDASSGSIVDCASRNVKADKSSGAIVNVK